MCTSEGAGHTSSMTPERFSRETDEKALAHIVRRENFNRLVKPLQTQNQYAPNTHTADDNVYPSRTNRGKGMRTGKPDDLHMPCYLINTQ